MGDGKAERVFIDQNMDSTYNATETAVTAYFEQFSNTLYMSFDVSCETGLSTVEPCLQKGDMLFITDANWGKSELLIGKSEETSATATFEDKFRITVDKNINWDGSIVADPDGDSVKNTGYVQILKFTPASTGSFTYVSPCSNR